ncbi:MAG: hypothetical protein SOX56_09550 [[Pasteurella] mairii]|uniref:Uncharacterized protein n=1 Tax=[Pasteurella] mairii TaxID=757 RepID=A0A379B406_9PAST|nr:hypothetical protein [[Pasteurella] mairii]SUB33354.1 Uncharacterised protein [[Pasteurella] mairii]
MNKTMSQKLAIEFANKIIEHSPATIFNDNRSTAENKAKQLNDFIVALSKHFEENLSEFRHAPTLD